jgi:tRNA(fMet)-specific endonuclease VapC
MRLLDTNVVIALLSGRFPAVRRRFRTHIVNGDPVALPAITLFELRYGIERSERAATNTAALEHFLGQGIEVVSFASDDACAAGSVRAKLEAKGQRIGPYDILIAAQALTRSAIIVTANVREFRRIDGLAVEDWTAPH